MRDLPRPHHRMAYEAIRPTLLTGDKVLFSGMGRFSQAIKWLTGCGWSHVAMVVRGELVNQPGKVLLWESCDNGVALADFDTQFIDPAKAMRHEAEPGDVVVRRLMATSYERGALEEAFLELQAELLGRPYELSSVELLRAALTPMGLGNSQAALDSIFCSELIAETDARLKLLPKTRPSNAYRPKDYAEGGLVDRLMWDNWQGKPALGPEVLLEDRCF